MKVAVWTFGMLVVGCATGCLDQAVDVELQMPSGALAAEFVPSCARSALVELYGKNYLTSDSNDYTAQCIPLASSASWEDVHRSISDKFEASLPDSGLYGMGVYGFAGDCSSTWFSNDLVFSAESPYVGGDQLLLPVRPNVSCNPTTVKVRAIDVLLLVTTKDCSKSYWTGAQVAVTTLRKMHLFDAIDWWGGQSTGVLDATGVVSIAGNLHHSADSCLAFSFYDQGYFAITCEAPPEQQACASGTEMEAALIDPTIFANSLSVARSARWGTGIVGVAWSNGPLANATVTLDEASKDLGEIVYLDAPLADRIPERPVQTATGPTGMFMVYTRSFVTIKITANGKTVTRRVGGYMQDYSEAAIVKL